LRITGTNAVLLLDSLIIKGIVKSTNMPQTG